MEYNKVIDEHKNQVIGSAGCQVKKGMRRLARVILEDNNVAAISLIKEFIEKPVATLECPESAGIYLFNKKIFDVFAQQIKGK